LWETPPFAPRLATLADGRKIIVGRGACDDKGQVMTFIEACRAFNTPVTGGNVSLYNESPAGVIDPWEVAHVSPNTIRSCLLPAASGTTIEYPRSVP